MRTRNQQHTQRQSNSALKLSGFGVRTRHEQQNNNNNHNTKFKRCCTEIVSRWRARTSTSSTTQHLCDAAMKSSWRAQTTTTTDTCQGVERPVAMPALRQARSAQQSAGNTQRQRGILEPEASERCPTKGILHYLRSIFAAPAVTIVG